MLFKDRKELADKYKIWVKQSIDNNQTMILDCAESLIAFLDLNGYMNKVVHGEWCMSTDPLRISQYQWYCSNCHSEELYEYKYCPNCGARMDGGK